MPCSKYQSHLKKYELSDSMSRKGNRYDNAYIEFFHIVLNKELVYLEKFKTRTQVIRTYILVCSVILSVLCIQSIDRVHYPYF